MHASVSTYLVTSRDRRFSDTLGQVLLRLFQRGEEDDRLRPEADQEGDGQNYQAKAAARQGGSHEVKFSEKQPG